MGCCNSSESGNASGGGNGGNDGRDGSTSAASTFHDGLRVNQVNLDNVFKINLLVLGAGESGKSTLLKQMRQIYGDPYTEEELIALKPHLIKNVIEAMRILAIYSDLLADEGKSTQIQADNEEVRTRVSRLSDRDGFTQEVCDDFVRLWNDPGIRKTFEYRHKFQLIDTADYLMDRMTDYCKPTYIPTFVDILHCRRRTIGVHKMTLPIRDETTHEITELFQIFDVGGQRMERKKWVHFFDHVHAVLYVTALSGYNQTLWEDQSANRMEESVALFRNVIQMESFEKSAIILFLNKSDLFKEKIARYKLTDYFHDFDGDAESFTDCVRYVKSLFVDNKPNPSQMIYTHVTCATDTENVRKMFDSVRDIVRTKFKEQELV